MPRDRDPASPQSGPGSFRASTSGRFRNGSDRVMSWAQEFDGLAGAPPDPSVWCAELGGGGWGDDQLQSYTRPPANAYLTGSGQLAIVARDAPGGISSARLTTRGLVSFR